MWLVTVMCTAVRVLAIPKNPEETEVVPTTLEDREGILVRFFFQLILTTSEKDLRGSIAVSY